MWKPKRRKDISDIFDELLKELEEIQKEMEKEITRFFEENKTKIKDTYTYTIKITIGPGLTIHISPDETPKTTKIIEEETEPHTDIIERDDEIWIVADMPGVQKENINIKTTEKTITIKAQNGRKYHKTIELPAKVNPETIKTSYKNGVLEIRLKKKTETKLQP